MCISMPPQEMFVFRLSYIASGAFLGTVVSVLGLVQIVLWNEIKMQIELRFQLPGLNGTESSDKSHSR